MLPEGLIMADDKTCQLDEADISFNIRKTNGKPIGLRVDFMGGVVYLSTWYITKAGRPSWSAFIQLVLCNTNGWEMNEVIPKKRYHSDTFTPRTKEITNIDTEEFHSILSKFA